LVPSGEIKCPHAEESMTPLLQPPGINTYKERFRHRVITEGYKKLCRNSTRLKQISEYMNIRRYTSDG
jgi:hypothetical protein